MKKRMRDLVTSVQKKEKNEEISNDVGTLLMQGRVIKKVPWIEEYSAKKEDEGYPKFWGGRFSFICPLENDVTIGMGHCSHVDFNEPYHCGSFSRVSIPLGCFIIFNCQMFHYGDQCKLLGCNPQQSVRAFGYLVEEGYKEPKAIQTFKSGIFCDTKMTYNSNTKKRHPGAGRIRGRHNKHLKTKPSRVAFSRADGI